MGGLCGVSKKHDDASESISKKITRKKPQESNEPRKQNPNITVDHFPDMEEYNNGKMIGEGIKKIPSYKCPLPFDELTKLRNEFWESKKDNKRVWNILKECCETDAETAVQLLEVAEIACQTDSLRCVYELVNQDFLYRIPNFCITDPVYEKDFSPAEKMRGKIREKDIIVKLILGTKETSLAATNKTTGEELKKLYSEQEKLPLSSYRIRFLVHGHEIKDDHCLYYHNIDEQAQIQVHVARIA